MVPEGDAVLRTARRLHDALAGARLDIVDLRWGRVRGDPLRGATTTEVVSVGKHLLHRVDSGVTVHSHLRMEGRWQAIGRARVTPAQRHSSHLRALLATPDTVALGWRLGLLEVLPTDQEQRAIGHLGPDLLGHWDEHQALTNLLRDPRRPIGDALLDQRNLAGLGTIFTSEPLFLSRVGPWCPVADVPSDTVVQILRCARRLLQESVATGAPAPTRDPREPMYVFGRQALPCRRCAEQIRSARIGTSPRDRTLAYCPRCQGGRAPTDDGRPQRPLGASSRSGRGNDLGVGGGGDR